MSTQPIWLTPAGSLGTVAEGTFYEVPLNVTDSATINIIKITSNGTKVTVTFNEQNTIPFQVGDTVIVSDVNPSSYNGNYTVTSVSVTQITFNSSNTATWVSGGTLSNIPNTVYFTVVAGSLPSGIQCTTNGIIQGVPTNVVTVAQEAVVIGANVTSKFAVRAYTTKTIGGVTVINRLADRTFTITVAGQNIPQWITPPGQIGEYFVGEYLVPGIQLDYITDNNTGIPPAVSLISGSLPPGLTITGTGLISGYVGLNPVIDVIPGFSRAGQGFSEYPFDFGISNVNFNYEFVLRLTDGQTSELRTFSMFVWSTNVFTADTTLITADDTYLTASISNVQIPVLLNTQGSVGSQRNNTFFAYQFVGESVDGSQIGFIGNNLPPGLTLDSESGWLYGYLPTLAFTATTYNFTVEVYSYIDPTLVSDPYDYNLTILGPISSEVIWTTPPFLGTIFNGSTSIFYVQATTPNNLTLQYQLLSGSNSRLPQGLTLHSSGNIVGRVSFNTFALDLGSTTFDRDTTTFDLVYSFVVNAVSVDGFVSATQTFTIRVLRQYDLPYYNLYIECMPPVDDRQLIRSLLQNPTVFPPSLLYRNDDPNFGLSTEVVYYHAYGLNAVSLDTYVEALQLNHYWKDLILGSIKTAQALDPVTGEVIYEVVYSEIIDTLLNNDGVSVGKDVLLAYPLDIVKSEITFFDNDTTIFDNNTTIFDLGSIDVVYPNSLPNMRDQVIDVVGQESNLLPLWMLTKQTDGRVLGFTPAWVIAYTVPGASGQIKYNIETTFGDQLNLVDFKADRYEIDNALTVNWNADQQSWIPSPPLSTTFDINYHYNVYLQNAGTGYMVGDQIVIFGSNLAGNTPFNDCLLTVNTVDEFGGIVSAFYYGTANLFAYGVSYTGITGTNIVGTGIDAIWNLVVVPGIGVVNADNIQWVNTTNQYGYWVNNSNISIAWTSDSTQSFDTQFDGGSLTFNDPADIDTNTNAYDKYVLFPKSDILNNLPQVGAGVVYWINDYNQLVYWLNNDAIGVPWI